MVTGIRVYTFSGLTIAYVDVSSMNRRELLSITFF